MKLNYKSPIASSRRETIHLSAPKSMGAGGDGYVNMTKERGVYSGVCCGETCEGNTVWLASGVLSYILLDPL